MAHDSRHEAVSVHRLNDSRHEAVSVHRLNEKTASKRDEKKTPRGSLLLPDRHTVIHAASDHTVVSTTGLLLPLQ